MESRTFVLGVAGVAEGGEEAALDFGERSVEPRHAASLFAAGGHGSERLKKRASLAAAK